MSQTPPFPLPQPGDAGEPSESSDPGQDATAGETPTAATGGGDSGTNSDFRADGAPHADGAHHADDATTTTASSFGSPSAAPTVRLGDELRTLRRSRSDRVVAGVLGGLGRRLGVDPVILRVVTVVLVFFGGVGVLFYALGWLLIPEEGDEHSALDQALGRGTSGSGRAPAVLLAGFLGLLALGSAAAVLGGSWDGAVLLVLAGVALVLLLRRNGPSTSVPHLGGTGPATDAAPGQPPYGNAYPAPYGATVDDPGAAWAAAATGAQPPLAAPAYQPPAAPGYRPPPDEAAATSWGPDADWEQPAWDSTAQWAQPPGTDTGWTQPAPAAPLPRPRSVLGPVTVSLALLSAGVLAVLDGPVGLDVPFAAYLAAALGVVGLGLLVGSWVGRSRGLVWLGLLLAIAMVPAVAADRIGSWEETDVTVQPTSPAELSGTHDYGGGRVVWDLTALELPEENGPTLTIDQGAGQLVVTVPETTDVTLDATLGIGELRTFETVSGGFGNERSTVDLGPDGAGGGELTLDLDLGIGQLEVRREAA
ncbi:MAG TPA: PspC domain-containing protein [Jiangellales bacterium]|nr:PspC domain-containing protein [Jiangellales bacterium]